METWMSQNLSRGSDTLASLSHYSLIAPLQPAVAGSLAEQDAPLSAPGANKGE